MDFLSRPFIAELFLTVILNQKHPAAGAPLTSDDVEMGGGDTGGDRGDDTPDNSGIVVECTITPILQDDGQPV